MKTESKSSLIEPAYTYILNLILEMKIKPGERVPEVQIAKDLGMSRTPIREALLRLASEGLVNIYPHRHVEVVTFDETSIYNLGTMRIALDTMAVRLAIYRGSNEDFQRLHLIAAECRQAAREGDMIRRIRMDTAFHLEMANISRNPILINYQTQILRQVELLQSCKYIGPQDSQNKIAGHSLILEAMNARDEEAAVRLCTMHLSNFYNLDYYFPFFKNEQAASNMI